MSKRGRIYFPSQEAKEAKIGRLAALQEAKVGLIGYQTFRPRVMGISEIGGGRTPEGGPAARMVSTLVAGEHAVSVVAVYEMAGGVGA